jgi:hypothetical protein
MKNARPANDAKPSAVDGLDSTDRHQPEQLSFLPPPPFNPQWPTPNTRDALALELFLDSQRIDAEDFYAVSGSMRLADSVFQLKGKGWPIESVDVPAPTEACPHRTISIYFLPARFIAEALSLKGAAQ